MRRKLIRHKIPDIIARSGKRAVVREADRSEMPTLLHEKFSEEVLEFFEKPSVEEACDIYEVFLETLRHWDIDFSSVVNHAYYKREEKGGFGRRVVLEEIKGKTVG